MIVGILTVELFIANSSTLKAKRQILNSIKTRLRDSFNIALAEIGYHDKWQKAALGIVTVGTEKAFVNGLLDRVLEFVKSYHDIYVSDFKMELL